MYHGYCFTEPNGWHTPKVNLATAEEALNYCLLQHVFFREVRITDEHDEFTVLHVVDHVLKCPQSDGSTKETRLIA